MTHGGPQSKCTSVNWWR